MVILFCEKLYNLRVLQPYLDDLTLGYNLLWTLARTAGDMKDVVVNPGVCLLPGDCTVVRV